MTEQEFIDIDNEKFSKCPVVDNDFEMMFTLCRENARPDGLVLEFGVYNGSSIKVISKVFEDAPNIFGFDSWEGLPLDTVQQYGNFTQGSFRTDRPNKLYSSENRITLVDGWFEKSLPDFMSTHSGPIRFINIDCDQYISTKHVFDVLGRYIDTGTVINFDEYKFFEGWENREYRAFREMMLVIGYDYEYIYKTGNEERVALVIRDKL